MKRILSLSFIVLLISCSPKITTRLASEYQPMAPEEEIVVVERGDSAPEDAVYIGKIKIGDTGFTLSKNGTWDAVVSLAKEEARRAGGNVVWITSHKTPDFTCSIHRIEADILRVEDLSTLPLPESPAATFEHPDYALVYLYRDSSYSGKAVKYDVYLDDVKVYKARASSKAEVKVYEAGEYTIWGSTESKVSIPIKVELGGEYYVRCSVSVGLVVGRPSFDIIATQQGKSEYESIITK